jgi:hypothetical protein
MGERIEWVPLHEPDPYSDDPAKREPPERWLKRTINDETGSVISEQEIPASKARAEMKKAGHGTG